MIVSNAQSRSLPVTQPSRQPAAQLANLVNLPSLEFSFLGQDKAELTGWAIYAEPVDKGNPLGAVRQVGDDDEGFSCVDDVARVAQIYLTDFERTANPDSASKAKAAIEFCLNLENGRGLYYNFVEHDGRINKTGHTSFLGFTWWTARAFAALAQAERVLSSDSELRTRLSASLDRTVERMSEYRRQAKVHPNLEKTYARLGITPGTLLDDSGSITALFALGLAQRVRSGKADAAQRKLLEEYGEALVKGRHDADHPFLGNLHINSLNDPQTVHLYGNHQVQALCETGTVLDRPDFIASARLEAEHGYPQLLASWMMPFAVSPSPEPFPQIAYSAECAVSNLQALYRATGETKFSLMAGLFGTWFSGANVAGKPVYHPSTGRAFDGVDPQGVSMNSGAESNAEALLAMQALEGSPGASLLSAARTEGQDGLVVHSGGSFVAEGDAVTETRGLNGGVQRQIWKLEPGAGLAMVPTQEPSWLTWHGPEGARIGYATEEEKGSVSFDSPTHFDVDGLPPGVRELRNSGTSPVWVESLTERPSQVTRSWSAPNGGGAQLEVRGLDTRTTDDDTFTITITSK